LHELTVQAADNLWFVLQDSFSSQAGSIPQRLPDRSGCLPLPELRAEFDYSIVQCPAAGESSEAAALGQIADGVILVVAADRTRRVAARKTIDTLRAAQVQLLGTVLSDRTFPIPGGIYRRL
jgi:receptor protein-tyrosine kinase